MSNKDLVTLTRLPYERALERTVRVWTCFFDCVSHGQALAREARSPSASGHSFPRPGVTNRTALGRSFQSQTDPESPDPDGAAAHLGAISSDFGKDPTREGVARPTNA
jgi:hypothetical protein